MNIIVYPGGIITMTQHNKMKYRQDRAYETYKEQYNFRWCIMTQAFIINFNVWQEVQQGQCMGASSVTSGM